MDAIIDTGATASFLPEKGVIISNKNIQINQTNQRVKTADNLILNVNCSTKLHTKPANTDGPGVQSRYLVLPNHDSILGYQAVIGLDLIKSMNISVVPSGGIMLAKSGNHIIGKERLLPLSTLATLGIDPMLRLPPTIRNLVTIFQDIFAEKATTAIDIEPMTIPIINNKVIKTTLRRYSVEDIQLIHEQIRNLLENGIIEPSQSNFSSRAHLVPKKNGQKRLVINYIPLNNITEKDNFPVPQLADLFNAIRGATHFAALDCTEGFLQIPLLEEHRHRSAFLTPHGLYQFRRAPFGFTNSPAKFQRTMNEIFEEGLYKRCVVYIDDILVFADSAEKLEENLKWVFEQCRKRGVKLKQSKCHFFREQVEFLGFLISQNSIAPIPNKCEPLRDCNPQSKSDILSILGKLNHYSRFIPNFSEKTRPLRELIKKTTPFSWNLENTETVKRMQIEIDEALPQTIPDTFSTKILRIHIAKESIEATCLTEKGDIICRTGQALTQSENNWTNVEKSLRGLVIAYQKFGSFLKGEVIVETPFKALENAIKRKERPERVERLLLDLPADCNITIKTIPQTIETVAQKIHDEPPEEIFYTDGACTSNGKPNCKASWAVLSTINPDLTASGLVEHERPSNQVAELTAILEACKISQTANLNRVLIVTDSKYAADAINNRLEKWQENGYKDHRNKTVINEKLMRALNNMKEKLDLKCIHIKGHAHNGYNLKVDEMAKSRLEQSLPACLLLARQPVLDQTGDEEIETLKNKMKSDGKARENFELINNELYFIDENLPLHDRLRLFVPQKYRKLLLKIAHDDPIYGGHLGIKKTRNKLAQYYWPRLNTDIIEHIRDCEVCQRNKVPRAPRSGLLQPIKTSELFERVHIDIVGPLKESRNGNKFIITAIDAFSRFGYARPLPEVRAEDCIRFLNEEIISKHGLPENIISDNGTQFNSNAFQAFITRLDIKHCKTADYHPNANGMDEKLNGTLVKLLRNYTEMDQSNWDEKLIWALFTYNTTENESTKLKPYAILYGREPRSPLRREHQCDEARTVDHSILRQTALKNTEEAQAKQKEFYDRNRVPQDFKTLDLVMTKNHAPPRGDSLKLAPKFTGPHIIIRIITHDDSPKAAEILDITKMKTKRVAFQDLIHFKEGANQSGSRDKLPGEIICEEVNYLDEQLPISGRKSTLIQKTPADDQPSVPPLDNTSLLEPPITQHMMQSSTPNPNRNGQPERWAHHLLETSLDNITTEHQEPSQKTISTSESPGLKAMPASPDGEQRVDETTESVHVEDLAQSSHNTTPVAATDTLSPVEDTNAPDQGPQITTDEAVEDVQPSSRAMEMNEPNATPVVRPRRTNRTPLRFAPYEIKKVGRRK